MAYPSYNQSQSLTLLNAVTANTTGTGQNQSIPGGATLEASLYVATTGAPTAGTVTIQTSPDNTNWYTPTNAPTITISATTANQVTFAILPAGTQFVRGVLSGLTGGTTPTVTATTIIRTRD